MHVVSDADVLIHLSKLEKLPLLQSLYKEIAIPDHVKSEILIKEDIQLQKAFNSFLKVFSISKDEGKKYTERV
jgi:predicted nucleic acid-binding protein